MFNLFNVASGYAPVITPAASFANEVGHALLIDILARVIFDFAFLGGALWLWHHANQRHEKFKQGTIKFQEVNYWPSEDRIPGTERYYRDQDIDTKIERRLEESFSKGMRRTTIKYMELAAERCTHDSPIIWPHLEAVIQEEKWPLRTHKQKENLYNEIKGEIERAVENILSSHYSKEDPEVVNVPDGHRPEKFQTHYVVIAERGAENRKQIRVILLNERQTQPGWLPCESDVRVQVAPKTFERVADDNLMDRIKDMHGVVGQMQELANAWMMREHYINRNTGRVIPVTPKL